MSVIDFDELGLKFDTHVRENTQPMIDNSLKSDREFPLLNECREQLEKDYLKRLLEKADGDRKAACRLSGISQARLYALLNKYSLPGFSSNQ